MKTKVASLAAVTLSFCTYAQKVGIGTTTPTHDFHVVGQIRFESLAHPGGAILVVGSTGVLDTIGFPGDSTRILRGDGTWGAISGGDNWGSQTAVTTSPLVGNGTPSSPITLINGSSAGDILVWDGTQWQVQQPGPSSGIASLCASAGTNYVQK